MHVVGIESIRNDEVAFSGDFDVIGQVVIISVAVVEKAAFFDQ
jgi:hypothetical protein